MSWFASLPECKQHSQLNAAFFENRDTNHAKKIAVNDKTQYLHPVDFSLASVGFAAHDRQHNHG